LQTIMHNTVKTIVGIARLNVKINPDERLNKTVEAVYWLKIHDT